MTGENQWEMSVASIILKLHGGRLKLHGGRPQYMVYWLKITDVNKHQKNYEYWQWSSGTDEKSDIKVNRENSISRHNIENSKINSGSGIYVYWGK